MVNMVREAHKLHDADNLELVVLCLFVMYYLVLQKWGENASNLERTGTSRARNNMGP